MYLFPFVGTAGTRQTDFCKPTQVTTVPSLFQSSQRSPPSSSGGALKCQNRVTELVFSVDDGLRHLQPIHHTTNTVFSDWTSWMEAQECARGLEQQSTLYINGRECVLNFCYYHFCSPVHKRFLQRPPTPPAKGCSRRGVY